MSETRTERLHLDELHRVHLLLALDCTCLTPEIPDLDEDDRQALATQCHIAQPVSLNLTQWSRSAFIGVLRIVLGAHNVIKAVELSQEVKDVLADDELVIRKLTVILNNWDATSGWSVPLLE